jgi:hypothetical protein
MGTAGAHARPAKGAAAIPAAGVGGERESESPAKREEEREESRRGIRSCCIYLVGRLRKRS